MTPAPEQIWSQPLFPIHPSSLSALLAAVPLVVVLLMMGAFRKGALFSASCGLGTTAALALSVWGMPLSLSLSSVAFGFVYAVWPIMGIVFAGLWLYNLACEAGSFDLLRRWMAEHASGDPCIQALLVAFCFGALLESCAGFGAPVAVTAFLLTGLGFEPRRAVVVALFANTAPVGFGGMGIPIVALGDVTGLDKLQLSAMVGRQLPLLSLVIPFCLVWLVGRREGLKRTWPAALVSGGSYACGQFLVSNFWGPYAADIVAATVSILSLVLFLRLWIPSARIVKVATSAGEGLNKPLPLVCGTPRAGQPFSPALLPAEDRLETPTPKELLETPALSIPAAPAHLIPRAAFLGWLPWILLTVVMGAWSYWKLFQKAQLVVAIPHLHNRILLTLYQKPYAAFYYFRLLEVGTAVFVALVLTAICFRVRPKLFLKSGMQTLGQVRRTSLTVMFIVGLAYLYNYSGMAYTLGTALAQVGPLFPLLSSYVGWVACFLSGSDSASNVLFGNLQVAAAHQLQLNPVLLAATNSSGGVISKMISPQNIAVGVTTVGLVGEEGKILRSTFWPSVLLAAALGMLAYAQAYWVAWMIPGR